MENCLDVVQRELNHQDVRLSNIEPSPEKKEGIRPACKSISLEDSNYLRSCALFESGKIKCWGWMGDSFLVNDDDAGTHSSEMGDNLPYLDLE